MQVPVNRFLVVGGEFGVGVYERAVAVLRFFAVESEHFRWSLVNDQTFFHNFAAVLDVLFEVAIVGLKIFHSLYSLAFSLYKFLKVVVSLRHRSFFSW